MNNRVALPVVSKSNKLLGIVTIDDILWVASEEFSEDMQKMGGTEALDEPYLEMPILRLFKKRVTWLVVLFLGELLTATAMAYFEDEIAKAVVLALFVPLIISSGGNSGSQASTLDHPGHGCRRDHIEGLVEGDAERNNFRSVTRNCIRIDRFSSGLSVWHSICTSICMASIGCSLALQLALHYWGLCYGEHFQAVCCQ